MQKSKNILETLVTFLSANIYSKVKVYIPTNTNNGFKGNEFLVNNILDNTSLCNWVTCKNKSQLSLKVGKFWIIAEMKLKEGNS